MKKKLQDRNPLYGEISIIFNNKFWQDAVQKLVKHHFWGGELIKSENVQYQRKLYKLLLSR